MSNETDVNLIAVNDLPNHIEQVKQDITLYYNKIRELQHLYQENIICDVEMPEEYINNMQVKLDVYKNHIKEHKEFLEKLEGASKNVR